MQPDPVDSTSMAISAADHGWDEQDQYESDKHKDRFMRLLKIILHKELRLDNQLCKQQQPEGLREQESPQRKWKPGEGLEYLGKVPVIYNLLQEQEEIERRLQVQMEHNVKEPIERQMCTRWRHDYFQQSLGKQGLHQPLPNDLPRLRRQIERLRIHTLQRELLLCMARNNDLWSHMEVHNFSVGVDTNNVFPSIYVPSSVRKFYLSPKVDNHLEAKHKPVVSLAHAKCNRVRKNIFVISSAGNGGSSSEGIRSTLTGGNNHHRETIASYIDMPEVIYDNQAQLNCTGVFQVLSNLSIGRENIVLIAANGEEMETFISGSVHMGNFILPDVHYCPDLGNRIIVSGSILDNNDYGSKFGRGKFTVKDLKTGRIVGEGRLVDGNYILDYLKILPREPGLVTRIWNAVCSALHRLGLNPQGPPM